MSRTRPNSLLVVFSCVASQFSDTITACHELQIFRVRRCLLDIGRRQRRVNLRRISNGRFGGVTPVLEAGGKRRDTSEERAHRGDVTAAQIRNSICLTRKGSREVSLTFSYIYADDYLCALSNYALTTRRRIRPRRQ